MGGERCRRRLGLVNVARQLGGSLGLGILVTVFAAASRTVGHRLPGVATRVAAQHALAHAVASSLTGSAVFLSLGLVVVTVVMGRRSPAAPVAAPERIGAPPFVRGERGAHQMSGTDGPGPVTPDVVTRRSGTRPRSGSAHEAERKRAPRPFLPPS